MLDTANRSFAGLLAAALLAGMLIFCGAVGCVLLVLVASRVAADGLGGVSSDDRDLWPAVVFIAIVGAGAIAGLISLWRQIRASRRLEERVHDLELAPTDALVAAAGRVGLPGRVQLLDCDERFSFAYGALTPRVVVSRGLYEAASPDELDAVLQHERYHVRNLDPLKVLLVRAVPATFFYAPVLSRLQARYVAARELAADRRAFERCGRKPLAGALLKVVHAPHWPELRAAAAIGGPDLLDLRVAQLESGREPKVAELTPAVLAASALAAGLLTALFVASVVAYGGPSAVAGATRGDFTLLDLAGGVLCAIPWAIGFWLGYRWLAGRTRKPLGEPGPR
jgi:beta-lactamase regulating signal transducer with metallopeptidase domain